GDLGDAATVFDETVLVGDRQLDPAVVVAEPGRPDDRVELDRVAVSERHTPAGGRRRAPVRNDAEPLRDLRQRPDQRLLRLEALTDTRLHGLADESGLAEEEERVASEYPLRHDRLRPADGDVGLAVCRELVGDLV